MTSIGSRVEATAAAARARAGIDIGGTFTDIAIEANGVVHSAKVLTDPERPERGVLAGLQAAARTAGVAPGEELVLPVSHGRPPVGHRSGDGPGRLAGDPAGLVGGDDRQVVRPERVDLATHALLGPHESGGAGGSPDPEPGQTLEHRTSLPDLQRRRGNQLGSSWRPGRRRRAARRVPEARATVLITGEVSAR